MVQYAAQDAYATRCIYEKLCNYQRRLADGTARRFPASCCSIAEMHNKLNAAIAAGQLEQAPEPEEQEGGKQQARKRGGRRQRERRQLEAAADGAADAQETAVPQDQANHHAVAQENAPQHAALAESAAQKQLRGAESMDQVEPGNRLGSLDFSLGNEDPAVSGLAPTAAIACWHQEPGFGAAHGHRRRGGRGRGRGTYAAAAAAAAPDQRFSERQGGAAPAANVAQRNDAQSAGQSGNATCSTGSRTGRNLGTSAEASPYTNALSEPVAPVKPPAHVSGGPQTLAAQAAAAAAAALAATRLSDSGNAAEPSSRRATRGSQPPYTQIDVTPRASDGDAYPGPKESAPGEQAPDIGSVARADTQQTADTGISASSPLRQVASSATGGNRGRRRGGRRGGRGSGSGAQHRDVRFQMMTVPDAGDLQCSLSDPRLRPTELYVAREAEAAEKWRAEIGKLQIVNLVDLQGWRGPLPISVPENSVYDGIEWYFHSVEALAQGDDCEAPWVAHWQIAEHKQSQEYAKQLQAHRS